MTVRELVGIVGGATWTDGWVGAGEGRDEALPDKPLGATRIVRADRLTRLAASVVERATERLDPGSPARVATVGTSVLASLQTNERYESRRIRTGRAPPRDFPYTAPNAWLGEIAAALGAQGPCLCFVGSADVALVGLASAIRLLSSRACDRAVVIAVECPPRDVRLVPASCRDVCEGASAAVLERVSAGVGATLEAGWGRARGPLRVAGPSSVDALARVVASAATGRAETVTAAAASGAACWVRVST